MTADEIHKIAALEASHWWYRGTREICMALLMPYIAGRGPLRILDIGSGTGGNLAALAEVRSGPGHRSRPALCRLWPSQEVWSAAKAACWTSKRPRRPLI